MPPPLHLALGLWFEKSGTSRLDYTRLREVMQLTQVPIVDAEAEDNPVYTLPYKLDSLKRQVRRHMPLLRLLRKPLPVTVQKQPSLSARNKKSDRQQLSRMSWQYWYDPVDLIRTILSATKLRQRMYFGMAQYVSKSTELWHSLAWGSFIRSTSGDVAYSLNGDLLIPGDFVRFTSRHKSCSRGRIIFIGRDHRDATSTLNEIRITLQAVSRANSLMDNYEFDDYWHNELYIVEDIIIEVSPSEIDAVVDIFLDREFNDNDGEDRVYSHDTFFIRRILNVESENFRPVRKLLQTRAELEVEYFGRDYVETHFSRSHTSFPYLLFIDDFGVHRNMYRALKAFYIIPACLSYDERRKIANVFTLTLGPHGAQMNQVVEAFARPIQELDHGVEIDINGVSEFVCAFVMTFVGDMPQQADNGGFLRHNAIMGCRSCSCAKKDKGDLYFDVDDSKKYHWETKRQREDAQLLNNQEQKRFVRETEICIQKASMVKLASALDVIQSRTYDAPHSEWRELGRILQALLFSSILTKRGGDLYLRAFQTFQYPPHWPRIQSPAFYIWSWSLSEAGRATILTPLILRSHAKVG